METCAKRQSKIEALQNWQQQLGEIRLEYTLEVQRLENALHHANARLTSIEKDILENARKIAGLRDNIDKDAKHCVKKTKGGDIGQR